MSHPDSLPTGNPTVGRRRSYGELPPAQRLGIGVVGLHEGHTLLVALRASGLCHAVAGCDLSEEKRQAAVDASPGLWATESYEELLQRPDVQIVAIYTPDALHADQILAAFRAGKHVICTKPLINDPSRAAELLDASREHRCRLLVGQSTRFYEPFQRQRELFESGAFGNIEVVDAHYNHRMDWYYQKSPWAATETHWAYLGLSHPVDLVRWYLGPIREVHAYGMKTSLGDSFGIAQPDAMVVNLLSEDGRIARVLGNYGMHELPTGRALIECVLMGSEGTSVARYPDLRFTYTGPSGTEFEEDFHHAMSGYYFRHELKGMHYGEFCNYTDYFASHLLSGAPHSPDLAEGLETVLTMGAIVESLASGCPVRVPHLNS